MELRCLYINNFEILFVLHCLYMNSFEILHFHSSWFLYYNFLRFQIYVDPFEEIGMAEKNAEQHRRSANEKEVRTFCC